ncbi:hypothetical protein BCR34DRAFT_592239 [Clohesyomyces aquaticus]|uniref:Polycomb protein VEFS-Box domain-containing protein n=1 Tax=Clohesyomyces aquaticus TaxID=1231657 RepID=A0A1Y1YTZ6_9PLEO|nr:hypothetical protein BCR34DRAFT_592239 [Clohesyomyces aquaticus]
MVGREDRDPSRLYIGNILFYEYLKLKRQPVFLQRNLKRILNLHERSNRKRRNTKYQSITRAGAEHIDRVGWELPPLDMMTKEIAKKSLLINFGEIIPDSPESITNEGRGSHTKRRHLFSIKTKISCFVWCTNQKFRKTLDPVYTTIIGESSHQGNRISIDPSPSLSLPLNSFQIISDGDLWPQGIAESYNLSLSFLFEDSADVEELLVNLGIEDTDPETRLLATCRDIIGAPDEKKFHVPLEQKRLDNSRQSLGAKLKVAIRWSAPKGPSILASANQNVKSMRGRKAQTPRRRDRQFSDTAAETPSSSLTESPSLEQAAGMTPMSSQSPPPERLGITWVYLTETLKRNSLECLHCQHKGFETVDELRHHLYSMHDHFHYRFDEETTTFESDVAHHKADTRASDKASDPKEMTIINPVQDFDLSKSLNGDKSYERKARGEKAKRRKAAQGQGQAQGTAHEWKKTKPKSPEDVVLAPRVVATKVFKVPSIPEGLRLHRTVTKRPLQPGEEVYESDNEPDTTWLDLKKKAIIINDPDIPEKAKIFINAYDAHMRKEGVHGDVHVGDALYRFIHSKGDWIIDTDLGPELVMKSKELFEDNIIEPVMFREVLRYMVKTSKGLLIPTDSSDLALFKERFEPALVTLKEQDITYDQEMEDIPEAELEDRPTPPRTYKRKGKERAAADVEMVDVDVAIPYETCLCGDGAFVSYNSTKPVIWCNNDDCIRHAFHIECVLKTWHLTVQLNPKSQNWFCKDCELDPTIETGPISRYRT